jgi:hypothetical protein
MCCISQQAVMVNWDAAGETQKLVRRVYVWQESQLTCARPLPFPWYWRRNAYTAASPLIDAFVLWQEVVARSGSTSASRIMAANALMLVKWEFAHDHQRKHKSGVFVHACGELMAGRNAPVGATTTDGFAGTFGNFHFVTRSLC